LRARNLFLISLVLTLPIIVGCMPHAYGQLTTGDILVLDFAAGTGGRAALFRVDPTTGVRTVLSDFGSGANQGVDPGEGMAIEASGQILATDYDAGTNGQGALFRIDPTTGARTILSDFGLDPNQGIDPWAVAVVPAPVNASDIFQGNLILQGNNVTTIEGRFDINGSIIVKENATLILRNALVNFTQSKNYQHVLALQNPSNGFPRLQVDNATITTSDYWFQMNFHGNSTVEAFKLQIGSKVQPWAHDNATVTVGNGSLSQFYALASSRISFTDSSLVQYSTWENSALQLINCTWAQTPEIYNQSSVMISFYLDVHVVDSLMQNVPEALVTATYMGSMHNWTAATASSGWARLTLWQMMKNASGDYLFPSYNVEAAYLTNHSTTNVNMTGNQQTTIEMEFVIPEFPSQTIIFIFITTALLAVIAHRRKRLPT